jgi:hypothetical protein
MFKVEAEQHKEVLVASLIKKRVGVNQFARDPEESAIMAETFFQWQLKAQLTN